MKIAFVTAVLAIGSMVLAQDAPGIKRDLKKYDPGPAPQLPKANETFVDPVFGTTVLRVTDETDGKDNHLAYSYWPTFNKDNTRIQFSRNGEPTLYDFDPATMKVSNRRQLYAKRTPAGGAPRWEDNIWSGKEPNVMFAHDLQRLWLFDVGKQEYTLLKDFQGQIGQMSRSIDDNVFAFTGRSETGKSSAVVWIRNADKIIRHEQDNIDEVQIDKSGRWLSIKMSAQGKGVLSVVVLDVQTGKTENVIDDEPDYAPGHSDNGHDMVIGHDNWRNTMTGRRLSEPHKHVVVLDLRRWWNLGNHVSMLADDERWGVISFYGDKETDGPFKNEIIQVATDGSQRVRRLVNTRTVMAGQYWNIPMANITRDGQFIAFASNYNGSGQLDVFILKVPPFTEEDQYPVENHPLMKKGE